MSGVISVKNRVTGNRAVFYLINAPVFNKKCHRRKIWICKDVNIDGLRAEMNEINRIDFFSLSDKWQMWSIPQ